MNTEVKTSFGTDDDQIKIIFQARTIASIIDLKEGTIIRLSGKEYGIIKNGTIAILAVKDVPATYIAAYEKFEQLDTPPKYPYLIIAVNQNDESTAT